VPASVTRPTIVPPDTACALACIAVDADNATNSDAAMQNAVSGVRALRETRGPGVCLITCSCLTMYLPITAPFPL
jgi:hypothetical protein